MSWGQAQIDALVQTLTNKNDSPERVVNNKREQTNPGKLIQDFTYNLTRANYDQFECLKLIVNPHERREDVRVSVNLSLEVCEVFFDNSLISLNIPMIVRAIDLSSGGIRIASVIEIPETAFSFCFCLPLRGQAISCIAEVVTRERVNTIQLYGCRFLNFETADMARLRNFVFTEQIRLNRKKC